MITFYTRPNCPLCEEAKLMLELVREDHPLEYEEVDIEQDEASHEKYMLMIPVIEKDGKLLMHGNIGYIELLEALNY